MLLLFICAEVQNVDEKLQETEEEIKCAITGKNKKIKTLQQLRLDPKTKSPSHYKRAKILIEQGGCTSGSFTGTEVRQVHDEMEQQKHRPMNVTCRHSRDVFEPHDRLRDPGQERMG